MPNNNTSHNDLTIQLETKQDQQANLRATICTAEDCTVCNAERNRLDVLNAEISFLEFRIATLANARRIQSEATAEELRTVYQTANETIANARSTQEERALQFTAQTIADAINRLTENSGASASQVASLNAGSTEEFGAVAGPKSPAASPQDNQTNQERADTMKQDTRTTSEKFIDTVNALPETSTRRWSFEIESNDSGSATYELECLGMDAHNDGSVSTDCDCDCSECEHNCDCDNCSISQGYDSVNHCGNCLNNEFAPDNSHPVITSTWQGKIEQACEYIQNAGGRTDSDTGGHIHVDGTGITPAKGATIIRIWRKVAELLPDLIGRGYCSFADEISDYELERIQQGSTGERYRAVNLNNLGGQFRGRADNYKNTVEFRQFAGTLDHRQIIARGYLCRAIVEMAISNQGIYWVLRCTTAEQLLAELGLPTR